MVVNTEDEEATAAATSELINMAKMRKGEQEFVRITQDQASPMEFFHVTPEDLPRGTLSLSPRVFLTVKIMASSP